MGLARLLPRTEMLVVTTPPLAAQKVAARAADMARKGYLRVAGVIENMSDFTCEHGTTYALFGSGGGARLAHGLGVPLIGSIPLHPGPGRGRRCRRAARGRRGRAGHGLRRAGPDGGRRGGSGTRDLVVLGPPGRTGGRRRRQRRQPVELSHLAPAPTWDSDSDLRRWARQTAWSSQRRVRGSGSLGCGSSVARSSAGASSAGRRRRRVGDRRSYRLGPCPRSPR